MNPKIFKKSARKMFSFLKNTEALDYIYAKSIPCKENKGYLVPLCSLHLSDEVLFETLNSLKHYMSGNISDWFKQILNNDNEIIFLINDKHGHVIGYIKLTIHSEELSNVEINNVLLKSGDEDHYGTILETILNWIESTLWPDLIILEELDSRKINILESLNFVEYNDLERSAEARKTGIFKHKYVFKSNRKVGHEMILTAGPSISAREASYALDAARYGWNNHWADYIKKFENSFADYLGVKHALSFSSCTGALHLALLSLGIGQGDEVIVPDITWVATANAVLYTGATPIFADIDPKTWCIDPSSIEKCITPYTKAIMPVHLYGHPAQMDEIMDLAKKHNLFIVEDAAPSIGAEYKGQKTGTFGDMAAFSFQGAKLVVAGEGGMLVTNNEDLYKRVYSLWDQGRKPGTFWIQDNGWKYKMSNIQAAIGLGQLERVDELIEAKRRIFRWYAEGLQGIKHVDLCYEPEGTRSIYWMSSILVDIKSPISRDNLREELKKRNVDTRNVFPAISQYPIWPKKQPPQPVAKLVGDQAINLPSGVCLRREQVDYVCDCIRDIMKGMK
ncbi:hypothetical protein KN63_01740 [Smithella sp. F21]|nr:hypothetical protein KN63_01740 [Smithella sp. F21]